MYFFFFFLMIRRPPRSTLSSSSAASDVYKRQVSTQSTGRQGTSNMVQPNFNGRWKATTKEGLDDFLTVMKINMIKRKIASMVYPTHVIEIDDHGNFKLQIEMGPITKTTECVIGGPAFEDETPGGEKCTTSLAWEDEVLVVRMDGAKTTIFGRRWLEGEEMVADMSVERRGANSGTKTARQTMRFVRE
eukprot:TRINITY_DN9500_c0_g1_i6.p1 TRINITY_DN9500_c0_g1~~TRINITY_DN9500_c0_g1_i6.p1  ORF type:complete len:189 (-),score=57.11 TRINITY_DN9500_c0_g1_i6:563-1129(-)